jgi:succinate dehydrogenase/fumarate reductase flavoprotein subunit
VKKGWILSANTIGELALKIKETEKSMVPQELEATVSRWNDCVRAGQDWLKRPPGTMMPIEAPPFYYVPVWPIISNTQGGPVHNSEQQVMDPFGQAIPGLYAAGELGSFFGHLYQLAGNLGECLLSGRIAGKHAAAR